MKYMGLNEVREKFLSFFESKEHLRMHSFPLVPQIDKSLLLINSGMAPLKPYFTGQETPPSKRVTTCQKCIRTPDIDNAGKTARHGTFFEMLGNFSFGNYFKKEAITWGWEFMTKVMEIPYELLYVSIYENDDEAYELWHEMIGLPDEKISRLGKDDNFWEIGTGPCGPCSEIYVDRGEQYGCGKDTCAVGCDCDRYIEVWNLVFTQFNRDEEGNYTPLDFPNIDTGMGLERMAMVMQEAKSIFEVDTVKSVLDYVCAISEKEYGIDIKTDVSIRVVTDHIRSVVFMVSDGIIPSNEGRGYVLRRLLRRASRHGKLLGIDNIFLALVAEKVINQSSDEYTELAEKRDYILRVIKSEEEKFNETINAGLSKLKDEINILQKDNKTVFAGSEAFRMYDTFGFPLELTEEILSECGMTLEKDSYDKAMKEQKKRARDAHFSKDIAGWTDKLSEIIAPLPATVFVGYEVLMTKSKVAAIIHEGQSVDNLTEGNEGIIVLEKTPFYAESGGQVTDFGAIISDDANVEVYDVQKSGDKFIHYVKVKKGHINAGEEVTASVNVSRRMSIQRNHSATHILHRILKNELGEHVNQAGSLVEQNRLRFDFVHFEKITKQQLDKIEKEVNETIFEGIDIAVENMNIEEAKNMGATALFGEKYSDVVRVVCMGGFSMELCGGCHIDNTSKIGMFKILSEGSVASGVRRIEAVTGLYAYEYTKSNEEVLAEIARITKTNISSAVEKVLDMHDNVKALTKAIEEYKNALSKDIFADLSKNIEDIKGIKFLATAVDNMSIDDLRALSDKVKDKYPACVVALASSKDGKSMMIITASKDVVQKGFNSGDVIKQAAKVLGGSGGGRADMAQAGIAGVDNIEKAIEIVKNFVEHLM